MHCRRSAYHLVEPPSPFLSVLSTCFPATVLRTPNTPVTMADDFQTYKSKSSRKRKADQMDVDVADDVSGGKKRVEFKAIASHDVEQRVRYFDDRFYR